MHNWLTLPSFQNILVTGGAGFIGSHLVRRLVKLKKRVAVIDDLSRGSRNRLGTLTSQIEFLNADITNQSSVASFFAGRDLIVNLAGLNTGVDFDKGRTHLSFEENMLMQMIPIRIAGRTPSVKKFIQISSSSVYSREVVENICPTPETAQSYPPEETKLGYSLAKKMGEFLAIWYAENTGLDTSITRFTNVFGDDDHADDKGHFIPVMIKKVFEASDTLRVYGDGYQKRSFIYVEDVISALLCLAEKGGRGEIYNVDSQQEFSVREIVRSIMKLANKNDLTIQYDQTQPTGPRRRMLDTSKLTKLGWKPTHSFAQALKITVDDLRKSLSSTS